MTTEANTDIIEGADDTTSADTQAEANVTADKANEGADKVAADKAPADKAEADKVDGAKNDADADKPAVLPDNWRELAAGNDESALKILKRYGSLNGVIKSLIEKEALIRSGKIKRDMPDAKDEKAMAEWRKDQGIPDTAEGYKLADDITKRLTDEDKPILSSFTEFAHSKNLAPDAVNAAAEWYVSMQEQAVEQRSAIDKEAREATEDALRDAWSRDEFKGNLTLAKRFIAEAGGIGDEWMEARLPDGRLIGSIPEFVQWASDRGRETYGDVVFASSDSEAKHASRRAEIEKIRDTDFARYEDEGLDREMRAIIEKDLKRAKR